MNTSNRLTGREIRAALFRTKDGFFLLFGSLFGGIPLIVGVAMFVSMQREADLLENGRHATASVVSKHISSDNDSTSYYIVYEFVAADGKSYGGQKSVNNREYYGMEKGAQFEIRYAADDPFRVAIPGITGIPKWVFALLSIFVIVGGTFLFFGLRGLSRRLRTYGSGLAVWGKNRGIQADPSMKVNGRPCRYLEFEYTDMTGQTFTCRSGYLSQEMISKIEAMETVPVVYLPDHPAEADLDLDRL